MKSLRSFAPEAALGLILALAAAGCDGDGASALAESREALAAGDWTKAAALVEKGIARGNTDTDGYVTLARAKLALGEVDAAAAAVAKASAQDPEASDVRLLSAEVAYLVKDYPAARKTFAAVAEKADFPAEVRAVAWVGCGVVEMTRDAFDAARVAFLKAIRLDRRCAAAYYHLGLLYRSAWNYPEVSLEQFEKFAYLGDGADPRVRKVQRSFIPELKETIAREAMARPGASRRNSAAAAATIAKAEAAVRKGGTKDLRTAAQLYEQALASDALSYPAALGLAKTRLRIDGSKAGLQKAYESYRQACALKAGATQTFLAAGDLAERLGYNVQAVEIYSRAFASDPTSVSALDGLIRALRRTGGSSSAAQVYQNYRNTLPSKGKARK